MLEFKGNKNPDSTTKRNLAFWKGHAVAMRNAIDMATVVTTLRLPTSAPASATITSKAWSSAEIRWRVYLFASKITITLQTKR
jgi:hypothetical protein